MPSYPNPFDILLGQLHFSLADAQGTGLKHSWIVCILTIGRALHTASPTAWDSSSPTAAAEVLLRIKNLGLGDTHAYPELQRFLQENVK